MTVRYRRLIPKPIAYLYNEPAHETVATTLYAVFEGDTEGNLSEINASEVFYLVARFEVQLMTSWRKRHSETPTVISARLNAED